MDYPESVWTAELKSGSEVWTGNEIKTSHSEKAKENQEKAGGAVPAKSPKPVDTREELAKIAGVSSNTISKVEKIHEKGTPEQIERARKGGKGNSVNAIYQEVTGKINPLKQKQKSLR